MKTYAGIGSRETPSETLKLMRNISSKLENKGYVLFTGDASGADKAFRDGVKSHSNIIVYTVDSLIDSDNRAEAIRIGRKFHPAWDRLGKFGKRLISRNSFQVLSSTLTDPVEFVICWTPDGAETDDERSMITGGTGQAISIADYYDVPVFNLKNDDSLDRFKKYYKENVE